MLEGSLNLILQQNLAVLQEHAPEVAKAVAETGYDGLKIEIVPTRTAAPSARVASLENDKSVLLHSAYDPIRESARWAENISFNEPTNVVVLGFGLGYHVLNLLARHEANIRYLILIENDLRIFRLALSAVDLRRALNRKGVHLVLGASPDDLPEILGEMRTDFVLHNIKVLQHDPSIKFNQDYYRRIHQTLLDTLTHDEVNLRTTFDNRGRSQFNIFMNIPAMINGYALKDCENLLRGYPAIVAAAGPSLDKNIQQLREIHDRAALFIVDTAQKSFQKHQIQPDVVVTGDPTPLNFAHFEQIQSLGEAFLAFHPEVYRQITQKFVTHPYLLPMHDPDCAVLNRLLDTKSVYGTMLRAMNVGHLAFNLARHMGCGPIILVGFDFAFPRYGGMTHSQDAAVSRTVDKMLQDGTIGIGGKEGKAIAESGKMSLVDGYYGEPVPTTIPFIQYINALVATVADCDFEVIDATEGGAAFKGTLRMTLQDALQNYLNEPGVSQRWQTFKAQRRQAITATVIEKLRQGRRVLCGAMLSCKTLMHMLDEWRNLILRGQIEWEDAKKRWSDFDRTWVAMVGQEEFGEFLGFAVQYLYFCRQRQSRPPEDTAISFLETMTEKYDFIVKEMLGLLENFVNTIDISIMALEAGPESVKLHPDLYR